MSRIELNDPRNASRVVLAVTLLVFIFWGFFFLIWLQYAVTRTTLRFDPERAGQFGDMFGGVNALFTGLALAGVAYAVVLQHQELDLKQARFWPRILSCRLVARVRTTIGGAVRPHSFANQLVTSSSPVCFMAHGAAVDRDIRIPASGAPRLNSATHKPSAGTPLAIRSTTTADIPTVAHPGRSGRASG
jgi:hypothetical protein